MPPTATATVTKQLIDSMIDQAHADNYQVGEVFEYRGLIDSGRVTRRLIYL